MPTTFDDIDATSHLRETLRQWWKIYWREYVVPWNVLAHHRKWLFKGELFIPYLRSEIAACCNELVTKKTED